MQSVTLSTVAWVVNADSRKQMVVSVEVQRVDSSLLSHEVWKLLVICLVLKVVQKDRHEYFSSTISEQ